MKTSKLLVTVSALSLAILSNASWADQPHRNHPGVHDHNINERQHNQQRRIHEGARSGELTRGETRNLQGQERAIRQEERQYKSDGKMTGAERKDLHQDMNSLSKEIYQEKHDAQERPRAR